MKEYYVIVSVYGGYWDKENNNFRGYLFATKFPDELTAKGYAYNKPCKQEPCYVIKVYDNT